MIISQKVLIFFVLSVSYLITRLVNLRIIPIFTDEAIYSYWAQVALHDPVNRFISLEDGKQPLFIWFSAILQNYIEDPLIAGRLVSSIAGFGSMIGIYLLASELFDKKIAKVAMVLYIILPFTLLYDRMALFDSLLTMFGIYSVLFTLKIAKNPVASLSILNGLAIGLGLITKSSANFFLYLIPSSLIYLDLKSKNLSMRLIKWAFAAGFSAFFAMAIFYSLKLFEQGSALFYLIGRKNLEFIRSPKEVLDSPFLHFFGNLNSIITWLVDYMGPLLALITFAGLIWGLYKLKKPVYFLAAYIFAPIVAELFFNKVLYPRFALFFFPYIIIILSFTLVQVYTKLKNYKFIFILMLAISFAWPLFSSYKLLTDPPNSKITKSDRDQYLNDWPAGYGVREITYFLQQQAKNQKVYIGTEGTFGLLPFAIQIYFYGSQNVQIIGYWPVRDIPAQVLEEAKSRKTFFIFNENQKLPDQPGNSHLKLVAKYQKGTGKSFMRLYEIIP